MTVIDPQIIFHAVQHGLTESISSSPIMTHDPYLDPGSGSYLLQLLIAGLVGSAFMIRTFWSRIKSIFTKNDSEDQDNNQSDAE
ncbi:MAG: hypothetical protein PVF85_08290 [Anaerolineales bacterium]|jgi:hypothetical protein